MSHGYVCRLTLGYRDVARFIDEWSAKADRVLVYEHEKDEKVSQTHCHFLIEGCSVANERLKRIARVCFPDLSGNASWSWKKLDPQKKQEYMTYMSKGKLREKYSKNFSQEELERSRLAWVEPVLGNDKHPGSPKKHDEVTELFKSFVQKYGRVEDVRFGDILDMCRKHTMSDIYHKTGKLPFPGTYKQTAGTLYLRVIEECRSCMFEAALDELKNLWY